MESVLSFHQGDQSSLGKVRTDSKHFGSLRNLIGSNEEGYFGGFLFVC